MIRSKNSQKGVSPIGILFMVCTFAFILLLIFKLGPHYIDYYSLKDIFNKFGNNPGVSKMSLAKIESDLEKQLIINNFREFNIRKDAEIYMQEGVLIMDFNYEVKVHMVHNIDVLLTFAHTVEVDAEGE